MELRECRFERAIRMSPIDPLLWQSFTGTGIAFIELRRFDEAIVVLVFVGG